MQETSNELKIRRIENDIPLVVDLDGTFLNTDLLYESIVLLIKRNPLYVFLIPIWLLQGKIYLKKKLHQLVNLNFSLLPYNKNLLDFLEMEMDSGREIVLATASLQSNAVQVAKKFPMLFGEVCGSEMINLKGKKKLEFLLTKYGQAGYDYIGNSYADLPIFAESRHSFLVTDDKILTNRTKKVSNLQRRWSNHRNGFKDFLKAIRAYQWIKNLLIFVPLITSHSFDLKNIISAFVGFIAFGMVASSGYLINDLIDLESDRAHARKCFRPMASGGLSIPFGVIITVILFSIGLAIAALLGLQFLLIVSVYFVLTLAYSLYLKKIAMADVFTLAILYSIRVIAGAILINVLLSSWLISFSMFLFLSLALVKRYGELYKVKDAGEKVNKAREYNLFDLQLLQTMGIASGFISVIVFSLYLDSHDVALLYSNPKPMWIISFLFLFWNSRIWLKASHGQMTDDPIIYTVKDKLSYLILCFIAVVIYISI